MQTASFVVTSWLVRCNFALCGLAVVPAGNSAKIAIVDWVAKQKWAGYLSVGQGLRFDCMWGKCHGVGAVNTRVCSEGRGRLGARQ
jgi:hypothetical protein